MSTLQVEIEDKLAAQLNQAAKKLGVTPEEFLRISVEEKLEELRNKTFEQAMEHVLTKNAELYKRLA